MCGRGCRLDLLTFVTMLVLGNILREMAIENVRHHRRLVGRVSGSRNRRMAKTSNRSSSVDSRYLDVILTPIRVSARYKPKFGQGTKSKGLTLEQFKNLY